jgi:hypothetical protein
MPKSVYVKCTVSEGIFEGEFVVRVRDASAYVDHTNVRLEQSPHDGDEVEGKAIAYLVEEKNGEALIELSGLAIASLRTWVPKADLASV